MFKKKGISLIVLAVTLAVMATIAGVIVVSIVNSSVFNKAAEATIAANIQTAREQLAANYYEWMRINVLEEITLEQARGLIDLGEYNIQDYVAIDVENGEPIIYETVANQDWRHPYVDAGTEQIVNTTVNKLSSGYAYNNPVIPAGFMPVNTSEASWNNLEASWNNGLVIEDEHGNQYVWVPVKDGLATGSENMSQYDVNNEVKYLYWPAVRFNSQLNEDNPSPDAETPLDYEAQITNYGGFYIGRYEAYFDYIEDNNIRIGSQKGLGVPPLYSEIFIDSWLYADYADGYTISGCSYQFLKPQIEQSAAKWGYDTTKVKTILPTGTMWSTVCKWIQTSGKDVRGGNNALSYGNVIGATEPANIEQCGTMQPSGISEKWKVKNIYDILGGQAEAIDDVICKKEVVRFGSTPFGPPDPNMGVRAIVEYGGASYGLAMFITEPTVIETYEGDVEIENTETICLSSTYSDREDNPYEELGGRVYLYIY